MGQDIQRGMGKVLGELQKGKALHCLGATVEITVSLVATSVGRSIETRVCKIDLNCIVLEETVLQVLRYQTS